MTIQASFECHNVFDRTLNPMRCVATTENAARNWCKFTSKDFHGVFAFRTVGKEPAEFWANGRKFKSARAAYLARS